ncbi:MAG: bifunctional riboflavin kinase/FAD synthetase [Methylophilales bacterium]|nr:bifunctional riboflavin kinase/FAD synthetase [Methylophilales bacterium]
MEVLRHFPKVALAPCVLAIGNFDGVHIGHQAVFQRLISQAQTLNINSCVMTFEPHPREFFTPEQAPPRLTSLREKLELMEAAGVQKVHVCHFDAAFATMSAQTFMRDVLHQSLAIKCVMVGEDFRFGAKRSGDVASLRDSGAQLGFSVEPISPVMLAGERVSSTAVRDALASGKLSTAKALLGRDYSISGHVVHGDKLGRTLGYPTANVQMHHDQPPLTGIYAVRLSGVGAKELPGVASLGVRPTVKTDGKPTLEVHLFDFDGDIYNQHVRVHFLHKIRDELKFADVEELKSQMRLDEQAAREYLG